MAPSPSPFLNYDRQMVIGTLKATGSRDPDVLYTEKASLLSAGKFPKMAGTYLMILGGLMTVTIVMSFIGIPMLVIGWWMRRRGVRNVATVEAAYAEYTSPSAA